MRSEGRGRRGTACRALGEEGWCWLAAVTLLRGQAGSRPGGRLTFFASPKKVSKKRRATSVPLRGPLRYSQRSGHLQTRFAQTMQVSSSERCSVAQHGLMAGGYLSARPLRGPRPGCSFAALTSRGLGCLISHASLLTRARHAVPLQPSKTAAEPQTSSFRAQSRNPCTPALQLGCCDYAQHDGVFRAPLPPSPTPFTVFPHPSLLPPHSSFLTPHSSLLPPHPLTPHPSPLTPHPSPLTPPSSPLTPPSSPLTPPSSPLTPHSSLLTPHPSPLTPHPSPLPKL